MKKAITISCLLLTTGLLSCRTTYLLKADFEGDAPGARPLQSPPGDPAGDSIAYTSVIYPRLAVQASTAESGRKALVFSEAPVTGATAFNQWLSFKGIVSDYAQPIWFYWTAKQRSSQGSLLIDVQGVQGLWVTRLHIRPNGQLVRARNVANPDDVDVLGTFNANQPHTIIISLQPTARKYNISVFGTREGTASNRTNLDVIGAPDPGRPPFSFEKPSIGFRYQNESVDATAAYVFEGVYITRKQPDM